MWILLVEMRQKGIVREVEQPRRIISHNVGVAWDEESAGAATVESLVSSGFGAEQGSSSWLRDGSLIVAAERRGVVCAVFDSAVREVEGGRHYA